MNCACRRHWHRRWPTATIARGLRAAGLRPNVVRDLIELRHTAGAAQRIEDELGPQPTHVDTCVLPAEGGRVVCVCTVYPCTCPPTEGDQ